MSSTKEDDSVDDFFIVNRWILKCAGLWLPENQNFYIQSLYKLYTISVFIFVNVYFTSTEFVSLFYTFNHLHDFIKNIGFALTHLMGAIKCVFCIKFGNELISIMEILDKNQFNNYENCGDFNPKRILKDYKRKGQIYTLMFLSLAHMTLGSSYIPPTITAVKLFTYAENSTRTLPEQLPYFSWMPFRFDTPETYLLAVSYQIFPMVSYAYSIVGSDTLFMNMMNSTAAHLTIIQGAFLTMRKRIEKHIKSNKLTRNGLYDSEIVRIEMHKEMNHICKHLQTIFNVCERLEDLYKYLNLAQATATLFILCTCLYLVSTVSKFYLIMLL